MKAGVVATAVVLVLLAALWFFTHGKDQLFPQGQPAAATQPNTAQPAPSGAPVDPYSNYNAPSK